MGKYTENESSARGTTIRTDFGRDRSDDQSGMEEAKNGRMKSGGTGNIDHSIKNGKVPTE